MKYVMIYLMLAIGFFMNNGNTAPPSLCSELMLPINQLLQSHETNIKIRTYCKKKSLEDPKIRRLVKGCYYKIPETWAKAISYPKLDKKGFILRHRNPGVPCPTLSFKQFEDITYNGHIDKGELKGWETEQTNTIKRLFRKPSDDTSSLRIDPLKEIKTLKELKIGEFIADGMVIRLVMGSRSIAPLSKVDYDESRSSGGAE